MAGGERRGLSALLRANGCSRPAGPATPGIEWSFHKASSTIPCANSLSGPMLAAFRDSSRGDWRLGKAAPSNRRHESYLENVVRLATSRSHERSARKPSCTVRSGCTAQDILYFLSKLLFSICFGRNSTSASSCSRSINMPSKYPETKSTLRPGRISNALAASARAVG